MLSDASQSQTAAHSTPAAPGRSNRSAPCPAVPNEGARSDSGRALTVRAQTTESLRADPSVYQEARRLVTPSAPTRESRPSAGAASTKTICGVRVIIPREAVVSRIIRAEVSRYCETCRRSFADPDAAEQHASRGHVVLTTLTTVTAHGCPSDVDRLILGAARGACPWLKILSLTHTRCRTRSTAATLSGSSTTGPAVSTRASTARMRHTFEVGTMRPSRWPRFSGVPSESCTLLLVVPWSHQRP